MKQAMVPSDVDVEDKIIGPFTIKQFIYLIIGAMIILILYALLKTIIIVFVVLAVPVLLLTIAFVFLQFNEQPFEQFLASYISFHAKPNNRIWKKDTSLSDIGVFTEPERENKLPKSIRKKSISHLDELAYILDNQGWKNSSKNN